MRLKNYNLHVSNTALNAAGQRIVTIASQTNPDYMFSLRFLPNGDIVVNTFNPSTAIPAVNISTVTWPMINGAIYEFTFIAAGGSISVESVVRVAISLSFSFPLPSSPSSPSSPSPLLLNPTPEKSEVSKG